MKLESLGSERSVLDKMLVCWMRLRVLGPCVVRYNAMKERQVR
jgi:hypothetical protein